MREFKYDFVGDPAVFQDRRQPPHSDHRYLLPGGASPRLSLNGSWYFHYAENWAGAPEGFFEEDRDCRGWDVIGVPGHIQLAVTAGPSTSTSSTPGTAARPWSRGKRRRLAARWAAT